MEFQSLIFRDNRDSTYYSIYDKLYYQNWVQKERKSQIESYIIPLSELKTLSENPEPIFKSIEINNVASLIDFINNNYNQSMPTDNLKSLNAICYSTDKNLMVAVSVPYDNSQLILLTREGYEIIKEKEFVLVNVEREEYHSKMDVCFSPDSHSFDLIDSKTQFSIIPDYLSLRYYTILSKKNKTNLAEYVYIINMLNLLKNNMKIEIIHNKKEEEIWTSDIRNQTKVIQYNTGRTATDLLKSGKGKKNLNIFSTLAILNNNGNYPGFRRD